MHQTGLEPIPTRARVAPFPPRSGRQGCWELSGEVGGLNQCHSLNSDNGACAKECLSENPSFQKSILYLFFQTSVLLRVKRTKTDGGCDSPRPRKRFWYGAGRYGSAQCRTFPRHGGAACPSTEWSSGVLGIVKGKRGASKCLPLPLNARVPAPVARRN